MAKILIVEDDVSMQEVIEFFLLDEGYEVTTVDSGKQAISLLKENKFDLVLTDLKLGDLTGIDVLKAVKQKDPTVEVIIITAYSTVDTAINAINLGAFDYIGKPFKLDELSFVIKRALEKRELYLENQRLHEVISSTYGFKNIIGSSIQMQKVFQIIKRACSADSTTVLISGESGTGKELVARALHFNSPRKRKPFVTVNCGAIPENLLESELFGHVKGAFTGAVSNKRGLIEEADGGTLFLDEIGELSPFMQVKLLRFLQEKTFRAVGDTKEKKVDVRVVAATNKDLAKEVEKGTFRKDLYYRLNVVHIHLPPLRERKEDIPYLVQYFVKKYSEATSNKIKHVSSEVMEILKQYDFPGNVRELENIIEHAVAFTDGNIITVKALPEHLLQRLGGKSDLITENYIKRSNEIPDFSEDYNLDDYLSDIEKDIIKDALKKSNGVKKEAARLLGITFRALRYKLQKYNIN